MKEQLQQRLEDLKREFASGQKVLADLQAKQADIQTTMLRLQGAIQVLEEELAKAEASTPERSLTSDGLEQPVPVPTNSHG